MENKEVIRLLKSPWSSPIVFVNNKDGTLHFCTDYRKFNLVNQKDVYPLPHIEDTLQAPSGSQ